MTRHISTHPKLKCLHFVASDRANISVAFRSLIYVFFASLMFMKPSLCFIMCDIQQLVDVTEEISTQFLHITEAEADVQGTQTAVAALQDLRYTSETSK